MQTVCAAQQCAAFAAAAPLVVAEELTSIPEQTRRMIYTEVGAAIVTAAKADMSLA